MSMAEYLLSIFRMKPMVVMSWGACNFKALDDDKGLSFNVNGFVYRGTVTVEYDRGSDTFSVTVRGEKTDDVHVGELIDLIDVLVETGDMGDGKYEDCVNDWLKTAVL